MDQGVALAIIRDCMRFPRLIAFLVTILGACLLTATAWGQVPVPALQQRATDLTGTLAAEQLAALEATLQGIEARTGSQVAVLLVPTTQPEAIEQFSIRVVEAWKLGRKGQDDGVLLLVAKNDRKLRIEVGYGLEGRIPDAIARRIIDETIAPHFKQGDFYAGIVAGIERIGQLVGDPDLQAAPGTAGDEAIHLSADWTNEIVGSNAFWWLVGLVVIVGTALRWMLGPLFGGLAMGGIVGGIVWLLVGIFKVALIAAAVVFIFVLVGIANWLQIGIGGTSGGGGGGGGFSGGGGGFGGGGASGSW